MENNNLFEDMPEAPTPPKLPKYFPDLQGENRGLTPGAGWYQNEFLPWIQNQDPKKLFGYGIGLFLLAGKLARIQTDFFEFPKFFLLLSGTAVAIGLGIHKYQDQIQESSGQITQSIKDAYEPIGPYLGEAKAKILGFLDDVKQKVMSLPSAFSTEPEPEE